MAQERQLTMHHQDVQKINQTIAPAEEKPKTTVISEGIARRLTGTAPLISCPRLGDKRPMLDSKVLKSPYCGRHRGETNSKSKAQRKTQKTKAKTKPTVGECCRKGFRLA